MKPTEIPQLRLTYKSIIRSFLRSNKKHLLITGGRQTGKSTLFNQIAQDINTSDITMPLITTHAFKNSHVELNDHVTGKSIIIGTFIKDSHNATMSPVLSAFCNEGVSIINNAASSLSDWILIDELGYLESCSLEFQHSIYNLLEQKRVIAVIRKQSTEFLDSLTMRDDVFVYDLDSPISPVGCVIMASGMGKRFGSNKLMELINGEPMISHILDITDNNLYAKRVVVTRHKEIESICNQKSIPVILHNHPERNYTVRLGLSEILKSNDISGCVFTVCDQPLLTRESLETLSLAFSHNTKDNNILRLSWKNTFGNPVLFGQSYFNELLSLPTGKGGGLLLKKYDNCVIPIEASSMNELIDIDTRDELDNLKSFL